MTPTIEPRAARRRAITAVRKVMRTHLKPRPRLTLSEWAEKHRILSRESSAEPGPWKNERVPYLVEIMDAISGSQYNDITIVKSSQTGGTEALNNAVGYYIDQEPSPILMIQPNVKPMAEAWSKDRLAPMLRDSPRLRGRVRDPRMRDSGNTILHKVFSGGYITIMGANSPAGLASRPIRVVLADELDRWTDSAGTEGDPLSLAEARMITFRHRSKVVKVSTPGNEGESRIEKEWEKSDQQICYVPCPHCGEYQPLEWRDSGDKPGIKAGSGDYRLVWDKVEIDGKVVHKPETAGYLCRKCNTIIDETHKAGMLARRRWVKQNPSSNRAGYHIPALLSPWVRWSKIAEEWLAKKGDPEQRKTFFNTLLGLLYVEEGDITDPSKLTGRRESWAGIPRGVGVLTMAIDVQGDRLEVLVMGWGKGEECWLIHFERLYGDPEQAQVWEMADALLNREWKHEDGAPMFVRTCCVDAGYKPDAVFRWVLPRQLRGVYATKGSDDLKVPMSRVQRANRDKVKQFSFNPTTFKDVLFARLRRVTPGPGYIRIGPEDKTGVTEEVLMHFGAEKRLVDWKNGQAKVRYILLAGRRNELIDLYNNNLVALRSLGATFVQQLEHHADAIVTEGAKIRPEPEPEAPRAPATPARNWATDGWR